MKIIILFLFITILFADTVSINVNNIDKDKIIKENIEKIEKHKKNK